MNTMIRKILQLAKGTDREMQISAVRVIAELGVRDRQAIRILCELLNKSTDPVVKDLILDSPIKNPNPAYLNHLVGCLSDVSLNREKMVRAVSGLGSGSIPLLERRYSKAMDYEKKIILTCLSRIQNRKAIKLLLKALLDSRDVEHLKYVCSLFRSRIEQFSKAERRWFKTALTQFMQKTQVKQQSLAFTSCLILLGTLCDPSTKRLLLKISQTAKDLMVRKHALTALAQLNLRGKGHDDLIKGLLPILNDPDYPNIVRNALSVLERCDFPKRLQAKVSHLLENSHPAVRGFALSKLGTFDSKENVTTLIRYMNTGDFRIREAARASLEKMPRAVLALLAEFENSKDSEKSNTITSILKFHRKSFKPAQCRKLFMKMDKLFGQNNVQYRQYLSLLRNVHPDFLYRMALGKYKTLKKKKKWEQAINYLTLLEGSFLFTTDVRYEMAICRIKVSKQDFSSMSRDQDKGLLLLQGLVKSIGPHLHKRVMKESCLNPNEKYYVGFHFSERLFELREFGVKILISLHKSKRGGIGKLAKRKLEAVGASTERSGRSLVMA